MKAFVLAIAMLSVMALAKADEHEKLLTLAKVRRFMRWRSLKGQDWGGGNLSSQQICHKP
jgi:hypothetical protein